MASKVCVIPGNFGDSQIHNFLMAGGSNYVRIFLMPDKTKICGDDNISYENMAYDLHHSKICPAHFIKP